MASTPRSRVFLGVYQKMIEVGILTPEDKVELLENDADENALNPLHDGTLDLVKAAIPVRVPPVWLVRIQQTVVLSDSQPEPDLANSCAVCASATVAIPTRPMSACSSRPPIRHLRDQRDKTRIYARGGIPCYWIVNLVDQRAEVYTQPSGPAAVPAFGAFKRFSPATPCRSFSTGATVASVAVNDLLP